MKGLGVACAALACVLAGCGAAVQNVTANDIRKPEFAYRAEPLGMSVKQAHEAVFEYERNCRSLGHVGYDAAGNGRMFVSNEQMGATRASVYFIVDVDGTPDGKAQVHGWSYYAWSHGAIDDIINAMKNPQHCAA